MNTPEKFTAQLVALRPAGLRSVVLYGSAAAGDFVAGKSTYNLLVIADRYSADDLVRIAPAIETLREGGHPAPMLLTSDELTTSTDAFAIELADIRQSHQILWGENLVRDIQVQAEHLRLQLERELKGKLLALRRRFSATRGEPLRVAILLARALSPLLVLARAALRLYQPEVPAAKLAALRELTQYISFDPRPMETVAGWELAPPPLGTPLPPDSPLRRSPLGSSVEASALFDQFLQSITNIMQAADRFQAPTGRKETSHD